MGVVRNVLFAESDNPMMVSVTEPTSSLNNKMYSSEHESWGYFCRLIDS